MDVDERTKTMLRAMANDGRLRYELGDRVIAFRHKRNGHPRLKPGKEYYYCSKSEHIQCLEIGYREEDKWVDVITVHRSYLVTLDQWREIRLSSIL